jgi:hypothetical protein
MQWHTRQKNERNSYSDLNGLLLTNIITLVGWGWNEDAVYSPLLDYSEMGDKVNKESANTRIIYARTRYDAHLR